MLRLVTQFDDARRRVVVATPTCCCCCCCLVTMATSAAMTAAHLEATAIDHDGPQRRYIWRLAATAAPFPIALFPGAAVFAVLPAFAAALVLAVAWFVLLWALYRDAGLEQSAACRPVLKVVVLTVVSFMAELVWGFFALFIWPAYLAVVVAAPFFATRVFQRRLGTRA